MSDQGTNRRRFMQQSSMLAATSFLSGQGILNGQISAGGNTARPALKIALLTEAGAPHLDIYLDCIAGATGVREVSVADASGHVFNLANRKLRNRFPSLPLFKNYAQLFEERKPDLAILSFSAHNAPAVIELALRDRCHVLSEKPACVNVKDFEHLVNLAAQQKLQLMLSLATRMNPLVTKARELVQGGSIGKLYGASMYFLADQTRLASPAYQKSWVASKTTAGGGHLIWLGIHYIDAIQFITGQRIAKVCGFIDNAGGQPIDVEDSAAVAMQFHSGMVATMQSGYYLDRGYQSQIHIWGSGGWLKADLVADAPLRWYTNSNSRIEMLSPDHGAQANAYPHFVQSVINALLHGTPPPVTAEESLLALKVIFGLYTSASDDLSIKIV